MPKSWTQADTRKAVCSLMSLQLVAVLPGLDCLNFGGVPRDDCAALYARFALCGYYVCMSSSRASLRMLVSHKGGSSTLLCCSASKPVIVTGCGTG